MYDVSSITLFVPWTTFAKDGYIVRQQGKVPLIKSPQAQNSLSFQTSKEIFLKQKTIKLLSFLSSAENKLEYLDKLGLRGDQFTIRLNVFVRQTTDIHLPHLIFEQYINANYPNLAIIALSIHVSNWLPHLTWVMNIFAKSTKSHSQHQKVTLLLYRGIDTHFPTVFQTKTDKTWGHWPSPCL